MGTVSAWYIGTQYWQWQPQLSRIGSIGNIGKANIGIILAKLWRSETYWNEWFLTADSPSLRKSGAKTRHFGKQCHFLALQLHHDLLTLKWKLPCKKGPYGIVYPPKIFWRASMPKMRIFIFSSKMHKIDTIRKNGSILWSGPVWAKTAPPLEVMPK